jgi:hypothetical protein
VVSVGKEMVRVVYPMPGEKKVKSIVKNEGRSRIVRRRGPRKLWE